MARPTALLDGLVRTDEVRLADVWAELKAGKLKIVFSPRSEDEHRLSVVRSELFREEPPADDLRIFEQATLRGFQSVADELGVPVSTVVSAADNAVSWLGQGGMPAAIGPLLAFSVLAAYRGSVAQVTRQHRQHLVLSLPRTVTRISSGLDAEEATIVDQQLEGPSAGARVGELYAKLGVKGRRELLAMIFEQVEASGHSRGEVSPGMAPRAATEPSGNQARLRDIWEQLKAGHLKVTGKESAERRHTLSLRHSKPGHGEATADDLGVLEEWVLLGMKRTVIRRRNEPSNVSRGAQRAMEWLGCSESPSQMSPLLAFAILAAHSGSGATVAREPANDLLLSMPRPEELLRSRLTNLDMDILLHLVEGQSYQSVASKGGLALRGTANRVDQLYRLLDVDGRQELLALLFALVR